MIFFSFCIFSNTAPTFYCQDWNTKQFFTLFWVSCSNDVHERASLKIFLWLCTGCLTLVWMFLNDSFITEKFWFCWIFHVCHRNSCELIHKKNRKPWNYNGTINFEIDIMKKSSPLNKNLCQTRLCLIVFWLFSLFFVYVHCNTTDCINWLHQKRSAILVLTVAKPWILNWLGKTFSWYQFPVFVL